MAIKKVEKQEYREFTVLIGCNTADETRYEIGDPLSEKDCPEDIEGLLEAGAIEDVNS